MKTKREQTRKVESGLIISVPIKDYYVIGIITRMSMPNIILCDFFFATSKLDIDIDLLSQYPKNKNVFMTGTLGFKTKGWKVLDKMPNWNPQEWPVPIFYRHTEPFIPQLIQYDDNLEEISSIETTFDNKDKYPLDVLKGAVSLQIALERIFPTATIS